VELPSQNGFRLVLAMGSAAALIALAVAAFLPRHSVPASASPEPAAAVGR
jgi:hypothetical protein